MFYCITGINCVSKLLKENSTLQVLDVGDNAIGDDGVSLLLEGFQCNVTHNEFRIGECGLSLKGDQLCLIMIKKRFSGLSSDESLCMCHWI